MYDSDSILSCFSESVAYLSKYPSVVRYIEVYNLLHSLYVLESNTMLLIDAIDLRSRDAELRKLAMKYYSSLLKRKMSPVL